MKQTQDTKNIISAINIIILKADDQIQVASLH